MNSHPKTAVILAAGKGTRRLPITRVIDKAMLPIGNRPTIDYVVEQIASTGVDKIIFVINNNKSQIKQFYGYTITISEYYPWLNDTSKINCEYIIQSNSDSYYGTAAALNTVRNLLNKNDNFIVLPADGFIYNGKLALNQLIESFTSTNCDAALIGLKCDSKTIRHYSSALVSEYSLLTSLIEKPTNLDNTKHYLGNISYYIFKYSIFKYIDKTQPISGEYRLTDTLDISTKDINTLVLPINGKYLDSGQLITWQEANNLIINNNIN